MKQLCYLCPAGKEQRFDALFSDLDLVTTCYDTGQIQSLVAFMMRERTIYQQNYILCDLTGSSYSQEHILNAVQLLRRFSVAELVFIAPPCGETSALFGHLAAQFRVSGLIDETGPERAVQEEVSACLRGEEGGYQRRIAAVQGAMASAAKRQVRVLEIPAGLVLTVAVAGTLPRSGVTTQVFALYHYLKGVGFSPCILDESGALVALFSPFYEAERVDANTTQLRGIPFCRAMSEAFDLYLSDLGTLSEGTLGAFAAADLSVLVGGAKPWELPALARAVALIDKKALRQTATLLSFVADEDLELVRDVLPTHRASVPYHPCPWECGSTAAYAQAILPCLKQLCAGVS